MARDTLGIAKYYASQDLLLKSTDSKAKYDVIGGEDKRLLCIIAQEMYLLGRQAQVDIGLFGLAGVVVGHRDQKFSSNTMWLTRCRRFTITYLPSCVQAARKMITKSGGN